MAGSLKLWAALVVLRVVWCLWPQMSYVDPAEFFDGTGALATRIFGFESSVSPGYDTPKPQTTIFFPYITTGIGFHALKKLNELGLAAISERTLLIAPRLMMVVVSLIGDACIFRTAKLLRLDAVACMMIYASSFVTLVFLTRNMTHAISTNTFALLLLLVVDSRKSQLLAPREEETEGDKKKTTRRVQSDPNHGFWLGVYLMEGTFNHPSFFIYALIPMVFWLTGSASQFGASALKTFVTNALSLVPGIITMGTFLLVLDSTYYGTLDAEIFLDYRLLLDNLNGGLLNNLTVAPLNFLENNFLDAPAEIKPKSTHLIFNLPLLFLPLIISFLSEIFAVYSGRASNDQKTITSSASRAFFALIFTTPLVVFTLLPTQDPKLLLPLIIPLVLMYANHVTFPATGMPNAPWIVWNTLFGLLFGAVLQGGVVPALGEIKTMVTAPVLDKPIVYHFVFYHTPTPPEHLLAMHPQIERVVAGSASHQFHIHDLGNADRVQLHQTINSLTSNTTTPVENKYKREVFVFAPASVDVLFCRINVKFIYKFVKNFSPHMSLESPPFLFPDYVCSSDKGRSYSRMGLRERIPALFSLNMYRVEIVRHFGSEELSAAKTKAFNQ